MPLVSTVIAATGLAISAAGAATQYVGQQKQAKAQKQAIAAQQEAENTRRRQMELDANRKKREAIRQEMIQRSQAVATATNQGAASEGSSALAGVEGMLAAQTGGTVKAINQNVELGTDIFNSNAQVSAAQGRAASGASQASTGSGISSLGGALVNNSKTIAKIGGWS